MINRLTDDVPKTGEGRQVKRVTIVNVEEVPCPESDGNHIIVNDQLKTLCVFCEVSWGDLDMQLNGPRHD